MQRSAPALLEALESRICLSASPWVSVAPAIAQHINIKSQLAVSAPRRISAPLLVGAAAPAPSGLVATALSNSQVKITWSHGTGETGYYIERSPDGASWTQISAVLLPGDTNHDGYTDGADYDTWFSNLGRTNATWEQGDLNGDGVVDGNDFDLVFANIAASFSPAGDIVQDTGLQGGTTYYYRIRAATASGPTAYSAVTSVTTLPGVTVGNTASVTTRFGNELVIAGTSDNDTIVVSQSGSTLHIYANGQNFDQSLPTAGLFIYSYGGNDRITVDSSVTLRTTIETIGATADTIASQGTNVTAWIDDIDNYTGTGDLHRVANFFQGVSKAVGAALPEPTDSGTTIHVHNTLWGTGPTIDDVNQGSAGDCYLLAPLAGLAYSSPNLLLKSAVDMGDGTYTIQLTRSGITNYLRVDDLFPNGYFSAGLKYSHPGASGAMWAAVIEKAYAYFRTGVNTYASLNTGWMSTVLWDLSIPCSSVYVTWTEQNFYTTVTQHLAAGKTVALATTNGYGVVVSNHAYTILSTSIDASGKTWYYVRNPWGSGGGSAENALGYATLSYAQLQQYFGLGGTMVN